jgi:transposase
MRIIGCDLHTAKQTIAMLDRDTGEVVEQTLNHDGDTVREFYAAIPKPAVVGIAATGSMGWFVRLMEELGLTCRVGHPAAIRTAEPRRQKHDRRDAQLLLRLLLEDRCPAIWMPTAEQRDLRALLLHRHQWVRMRTRVQHALQAMALGQGVRRAPRCGAPKAKPYSRRCRSCRTPPIGATHCRPSIGSWTRTLSGSMRMCAPSPSSDRAPGCS